MSTQIIIDESSLIKLLQIATVYYDPAHISSSLGTYLLGLPPEILNSRFHVEPGKVYKLYSWNAWLDSCEKLEKARALSEERRQRRYLYDELKDSLLKSYKAMLPSIGPEFDALLEAQVTAILAKDDKAGASKLGVNLPENKSTWEHWKI